MGKAHPEVIDGGVVKLSFPAHHPYRLLLKISVSCREFLLYLFIVGKCLFLYGIVLHHNHFQVRIASGKERTNGQIQILTMVLTGDNHGNKRKLPFLLLQGIVAMIVAVGNATLHLFNGKSQTLGMVENRPFSGSKSIELCLRILCRGKLVRTPMIEHLPDMDNGRRGEERLFLRLFLLFAKACRLFSSFRLFA